MEDEGVFKGLAQQGLISMLNPRLMCLRHIHYTTRKTPDQHRHPFFQVCYVLEGRGCVLLNGGRHELVPGDVHVYHPEWSHDIWTSSEKGLGTLDLRFLCDDLPEAQIPSFLRSHTEPILNLLHAIEYEGRNRLPGWQEMAHAYLVQLVTHLIRCSPANTTASSIPQKALKIMQASLPNGISISELAELLHISPTHFSNLFKGTFGKAPQQYLTELKLEYVKHKLLTQPNMRIRELSAACGWRDQRHFRELFKTYTGRTPSEFRSLYQDGSWEHYTVESYLLFDPSLPMYWISVSSSPGGNSAE